MFSPLAPPQKEPPVTSAALEETKEFIFKRSKHRPKIAIICGSGLGGLADQLDEKDELSYSEIPNYPISTVKFHAGKLVLGVLEKIPVVCMQGRFHLYEGYPLSKVAMPVRVFKLMGVESIIVTNAAGGINSNYSVGDIMLIKDHINMPALAGYSPLYVEEDSKYGPNAPSVSNAYDRNLRKKAKDTASELGMEEFTKEGVYCMVGGPSFETVAELRFLQHLGVDAVGMSTVPEVLVARHCGMKVFAFSLITNKCIMEFDSEEDDGLDEILDCAKAREKDLQKFVKEMVMKMSEDN